ncbi:hypothetical protein ACA910_020661 [Epithemia clementina (nom. ined.)]
MDDRNDPNLTICRLSLRGNAGSAKPPVRLPVECLQASEKFRLAPLYTFDLEKRVLVDAEKVHRQQSSDSDEIKKSVLAKMKSITSADESICIAILEDHKYDLKTSIEAFFTSS